MDRPMDGCIIDGWKWNVTSTRVRVQSMPRATHPCVFSSHGQAQRTLPHASPPGPGVQSPASRRVDGVTLSRPHVRTIARTRGCRARAFAVPEPVRRRHRRSGQSPGVPRARETRAGRARTARHMRIRVVVDARRGPAHVHARVYLALLAGACRAGPVRSVGIWRSTGVAGLMDTWHRLVV